MIEKVCPIVLRKQNSSIEMLAFQHPHAGRQFVKGTIKLGEKPVIAAARELYEESGILVEEAMNLVSTNQIGEDNLNWYFFTHVASGLPDGWDHQTLDDHGHVFSFFWHPLGSPLDQSWHAMFHEAYSHILPRIKL